MKDLRALILSLLAAGALLSASAGTAWAIDPPPSAACAADGTADEGDKANSSDKDPQGANSELDEGEGQNSNADKGTDADNNNNNNNQCGPNETGETGEKNETGEKKDETAGPGTNQNGETGSAATPTTGANGK